MTETRLEMPAVGASRHLAGPDAHPVPGPAPARQRRCRGAAIRARDAWFRGGPGEENCDEDDARDGCRNPGEDGSPRFLEQPQGPYPPPRDAATLIIIDRKPKVPKVLMGKRHEGLNFMPGKFVFPGGRIEAGDRSMAGDGRPSSARRAGPHGQGDPPLDPALPRPGARRHPRNLRGDRPPARHQGLRRPRQGPGRHGLVRRFRSAACFRTWRPCTSSRRAITPPKRVRRFDTRFFAVDRTAIADEVEGIVGPESELVELTWVTIAQAKALDLPPITTVILGELQARPDRRIRPPAPGTVLLTSSVAVSCGSCRDGKRHPGRSAAKIQDRVKVKRHSRPTVPGPAPQPWDDDDGGISTAL